MDRNIVVDQATDADLDAAVLLFNAYRVFYRQSSDMDAARRFLSERFRRRDAVMFLARMDGAACGFTQLYPSLSSVAMRPIWILNDLYVSPNARARGVGRRLMDRARDFAHASGGRAHRAHHRAQQ